MTRCCILYLVGGQERRSPWFTSRARAAAALTLIQAKHGAAVVYRD